MSVRAVLCLGGANLDHVLELDALPTGEGKRMARASRWSGGGLAATAAVAVATLGGQAVWCGLLGGDENGLILAKLLADAGVELAAGTEVPDAQTPVASVLIDTVGRRWLGFHAGASLDVGQPPPLPDVARFQAVVADSWSPALTTAGFERARSLGVPSVFDCEFTDGDAALELAPLAGHVVFSAEGLLRFTDIADVDTALRAAAERLPGAVVAVTLGPDGSAWLMDAGVSRVPAPRIHARDTTGCGDVFHGTYALGLAEGMPVLTAARFATATAALKAERGSGWSGMPPRADVERLLTKGWT